MTRRTTWLWLALAGLLGVAGCTSPTPEGRSAPSVSAPTVAPSSKPVPTSTSVPASPPGPASSAASEEPANPVSLPALMTKNYDGRALRTRQVLLRTDAYTRYAVTYRSGDLRISGVMNVPTGPGPFPVLILNHGYIDPDIYHSGQGLMREQDYLARHGYAVLHTDYRNHAGSDDDPRSDRDLRLGYAEDVINAVLAVKRSSIRRLDGERVGLLGRSMGGGVTYNALVARPGLVDAAVVFAPVSSNAVDNFDRWTRGESDRRDLARAIIREHGSPERNPEFWRNLSAVTFFDRVTEPVLMHHGTADESCPIRWSRVTLAELRRQDKDARLFTYPGEAHAFGPAWPLSMRRTVAFLDRHLGS